MRNKYGYVPKGKKNEMSHCTAVWSVAFSMEHLQVASLGVTNVIVLDSVGLHKVAKILDEFPVIEPGVKIGSQQLSTSNLCLLFLPSYSPFLNPIEEVFGWLKKVVKKGTSPGPNDMFNLLHASIVFGFWGQHPEGHSGKSL
ncbi:hypothetical protein DSO57_1008021 [Entomophthora muscae]|uniref:Uncharacterized protein n=2 Tax=Entomophthora muscae TaxID=34485 RepID=A0ACC2TSU3_9FUNG|nr:hypothetical protein DSO57_1014676 [Entomophthora muscae]KAJ9089922.1 hypothetical protein DSO57_1008021 [Entomophthora muscae]